MFFGAVHLAAVRIICNICLLEQHFWHIWNSGLDGHGAKHIVARFYFVFDVRDRSEKHRSPSIWDNLRSICADQSVRATGVNTRPLYVGNLFAPPSPRPVSITLSIYVPCLHHSTPGWLRRGRWIVCVYIYILHYICTYYRILDYICVYVYAYVLYCVYIAY